MEADSEKKKYSISLLIPKSNKALVKQLRAAIDAAKELGKSKWGGKIPASLRNPMRDGDVDRPDDPSYEGMWFINATSNQKPGVIDTDGNKLTTEDEFYSGCFARFLVNFFPYNAAGNKGVGCGLQHLQKTKDGERLSGRIGVESAFDDDYQPESDDDDDDDLLG